VLNIDKSNIVIFHPPQKKIHYHIKIIVDGKNLCQVLNTKYLGVFIDSHLNWKDQVTYLAKKVKRNIGALSKLRHFTSPEILINLYYSLVYPFFTYGNVAWGNTYPTTIKTLFILQKKAILRIITHSKYDDHTDSLFKAANILKLEDLIYYCNATFLYDYHYNYLSFLTLFLSKFLKFTIIIQDLQQNQLSPSPMQEPTMINSTYAKGAEVWNSIREEFKTLSKQSFKKKLKDVLLSKYAK